MHYGFNNAAIYDKYDERARILRAFDWEKNQMLNLCFGLLVEL